jgi:hypothetical protein
MSNIIYYAIISRESTQEEIFRSSPRTTKASAQRAVDILATGLKEGYLAHILDTDPKGLEEEEPTCRPFCEVDFRIDNHGSICILNALTPAAKSWVEQHLSGEETQTWGANGTVVEPRYLHNILEGIQSEGFVVDGL